MRSIAVIGVGYVGLVTGACFSDLGNEVWCVDIDEGKISKLRKGTPPFYEPGLEEMVRRNLRAGRLHFTTSYEEALRDARYAFIAVGTPEGVNWEADLRYVRMAAESIASAMRRPLIVVNKSTVPVGTGDWVSDIIKGRMGDGVQFSVVSNPEFLREGSAIADFLNPDRIVIGSLDRKAAEEVAQLYLPLRAPIVITDLRTAEMIKYASNAFLATRISFINEIADICEAVGADVKEVAAGMGYDRRIGHKFLDAGLGWGGSCFPKDVKALARLAVSYGCEPKILKAAIEVNEGRRVRIVRKLREVLGGLDGAVVGLLGLAFKPNTDDMREAPSVYLAGMLLREGAKVKGYDPEAMDNARRLLAEVRLCRDPYDLAEGCDALVVVTDWNEFKQLDLYRIRELMRRPVVVDGRNIYEPRIMKEMGFIYHGMGRGAA